MNSTTSLFKQDHFCLLCGSAGGSAYGSWHKPACAAYRPYNKTAARPITELEGAFDAHFERIFKN